MAKFSRQQDFIIDNLKVELDLAEVSGRAICNLEFPINLKRFI